MHSIGKSRGRLNHFSQTNQCFNDSEVTRGQGARGGERGGRAGGKGEGRRRVAEEMEKGSAGREGFQGDGDGEGSSGDGGVMECFRRGEEVFPTLHVSTHPHNTHTSTHLLGHSHILPTDASLHFTLPLGRAACNNYDR